jgi:hypothetical protein
LSIVLNRAVTRDHEKSPRSTCLWFAGTKDLVGVGARPSKR